MSTDITTPTQVETEIVELDPSFNLAIAFIGLGLTLVWISKVAGGVVTLLGLFLLVQTFRIYLKFSDTALAVYNGNRLIRSFPYKDWSNYRIFWQPVPILFYFREVNSIHFLPILFDPKTLATCLEKYCPRI